MNRPVVRLVFQPRREMRLRLWPLRLRFGHGGQPGVRTAHQAGLAFRIVLKRLGKKQAPPEKQLGLDTSPVLKCQVREHRVRFGVGRQFDDGQFELIARRRERIVRQ